MVFHFSGAFPWGDSRKDPPIILEKRTVKRVTFALGNENEAMQQQPPLALPPKPRSLGATGIFALLALGAVIGVGLFWYWNRETPLQPSQIKSIAVLPLRTLVANE